MWNLLLLLIWNGHHGEVALKILIALYYDIKSNLQKHFINNINFQKFRGNPINKMITRVLSNKVNFYKNQNTALFCIKLINKINKI